MRALVTGATGFLGGALARRLLSQGDEVHLIARPESARLGALSALPARVHVMPLSDLRALSDEGPFDVFYHCAWDGAGSAGRALSDVQRANVPIALRALEDARALGCGRFVFTGSQAEYGDRHALTDESAPAEPLTEYGKAKLEVWRLASEAAERLGIEYVHARVFSVYGAGDHPWTIVESCVRGFLAGECVRLSDCRQTWNFLHISDASNALCHIGGVSLSRRAEIVNIASTDTRMLREFVEEMRALCGGRGNAGYGMRPAGNEKVISLHPGIQKLLGWGWKPKTTFDAGIQMRIRELSGN